jgi:hypothetical protein
LRIKQKPRLRRPHRSAADTLLQSIDLAVAVHRMVRRSFTNAIQGAAEAADFAYKAAGVDATLPGSRFAPLPRHGAAPPARPSLSRQWRWNSFIKRISCASGE